MQDASAPAAKRRAREYHVLGTSSTQPSFTTNFDLRNGLRPDRSTQSMRSDRQAGSKLGGRTVTGRLARMGAGMVDKLPAVVRKGLEVGTVALGLARGDRRSGVAAAERGAGRESGSGGSRARKRKNSSQASAVVPTWTGGAACLSLTQQENDTAKFYAVIRSFV